MEKSESRWKGETMMMADPLAGVLDEERERGRSRRDEREKERRKEAQS